MVDDEPTLLDQERVPGTLRIEAPVASSGPRTPTLTIAAGADAGRWLRMDFRHRAIFLGRDESCEMTIDDASVSRRHARVYLSADDGGPVRVVLQDLESTNGTFVNDAQVDRATLVHGDRVHLGDVLLRFEMLDAEDFRYREGVARRVEESDRDPLTRLLSRQAMGEHLPELLADCEAGGRAVSAVLMDIDHFKQINDRYGHGVGDQVLGLVAAVARSTTRDDDLAIRYGGEELLLILAGARRLHARLLAERVREEIARLRIPGLPKLRVTASFGVAERAPAEDVGAWIERADKALYLSKSRGRNRSEAAPPP